MVRKGTLIPKRLQRPKWTFLILGRLAKLDSRLDSYEILHNRELPRVLAKKIIFIKKNLIVSLICLFFKMQFYSDTVAED